MTKSWAKERQWEMSKAEQKFEDLLHSHGYEILGYREYQSKTDLKITKYQGIDVEWAIPHVPFLDAMAMFKSFEETYTMKVEYFRAIAQKLCRREVEE